MAARRSRRLAGLPAQLETFSDKCFVCLNDLEIDDLSRPSLREMGCCGKYIHGRCYEQLLAANGRCGNCRGELVERILRTPVAPDNTEARRELALASIAQYIQGGERFRQFPNVSNVSSFSVSNGRSLTVIHLCFLVALPSLFGFTLPILALSARRCQT